MIREIFENSFHSSWPSIVIIVITLITIRIAYLNHHRQQVRFYKEFWNLVGVIYILLLYQLVTKVDLNYMSGVNLVPFKEILRYDIESEMFLSNVIGNIVLFVPFGFIIASYIKPKNMWSNVIIAIIISATIEFVQLRIGRSFDIDDIILNTLGCIIGYLLYIGFNAILRHLPNFMKSDWFCNLICIIITICVVLYILSSMGIVF